MFTIQTHYGNNISAWPDNLYLSATTTTTIAERNVEFRPVQLHQTSQVLTDLEIVCFYRNK